MFKKIVLVVFSFYLFIGLSQAQKGYELGPWVGVSNYFGELNANYRLTDFGPAGGIAGRYNFGNRTATKASLSYGYVYGKDADNSNVFQRRRNLDFKSHLADFSFVGEFNFLPYTHGDQLEYFTPYVSLGANIFYYAPFTELDGENHFLRPLGTEGQAVGDEYFFVNGGIVYGGGFKWDINYKWSINIELTMRHLFTDYLDDVSKTYPGEAQLVGNRGPLAAELSDRSIAPQIGEAGRQRGDDSRRDSYSFFGISIMRYFGSVECPKISK
jgi:hypothetical protein